MVNILFVVGVGLVGNGSSEQIILKLKEALDV